VQKEGVAQRNYLSDVTDGRHGGVGSVKEVSTDEGVGSSVMVCSMSA
jgi:hypothetical protein